jgi:hypothetical protein
MFDPSGLVDDEQRRAAESSRGSGRILNQYQSALRGVACGIAAVAMAAITFGLLVALPATIEPGSETPRTLTASPLLATPLGEVVTVAAHQVAEIRPAVGCGKANRSRPPETRCPRSEGAQQPAKSDNHGVGCLDVS